MSEREDTSDKNVEEQQHQQQQQQQQQASSQLYQAELSDDNPIENDVEHTVTDEGQKSASADSGAEEIGSPEQQAIHGTCISN